MAQKCFFHPRDDATGSCESCKLSICDQCELEGLCRDCRNKRRAIADRQRRAAQAREAGEDAPPLEAPPEPAQQQQRPWTYDPERVAYRRPELPQPVVRKPPRPTLSSRLAALDARLWGVIAACLVIGVGAWLGWWGGGGPEPVPEAAVPTPAGVPTLAVTPVPAPATPAPATRAVWAEAERLAQRQLVEGSPRGASPAVASPVARAQRPAPGATPRPEQAARPRPGQPSPRGGPVAARPSAPGPRGGTRRPGDGGAPRQGRGGLAGGKLLAEGGVGFPGRERLAGSRATPPVLGRLAGVGAPGAGAAAGPGLSSRRRQVGSRVAGEGRLPSPRAGRLARAREQARARRQALLRARRYRPPAPPLPRVEPPGTPLVTRWDD
ncbi:MAG: hypothetical protein VKS61_01890 [Candidatus Sericytochromatia bacterium]|nr:hypothetical protein [Candidatus Sericytochromatia bacterium]